MGNERIVGTVVTPDLLRRFLRPWSSMAHASAPTLQFSEWLYDRMWAERLSQRQLGLITGVDHTTISRLLKGGREPGVDIVAAITHGLELDEIEKYDVVILSVPAEKRWEKRTRIVFHDGAPALSGSFGEQLKGYRIARGLSGRSIANRTAENHTAFTRRENFSQIPGFSRYVQIVFEYGLNPRQNARLFAAARAGYSKNH